jgi:GntR family transcriptional regulator
MAKNNEAKANDGVQLFHRLQAALAGLISTMNAGDRLPAEPELAKQLGVSRATLREAMRTFEGQGLIRRRQGIGTFVVSHSQVIESGLEVLESIETLSRRIGLDVTMGALVIKQIGAGETSAAALCVDAGAPLVCVTRTINAEKRPVAYLIDILPGDVLSPEDLNQGFTGSVLDLLLKRGSPFLSASYTEIKAVEASSEVARALQIQRRDGLLMFEAMLQDGNGRVVDHSSSYFLPGYFRFHVVRRIGTDAGHLPIN